MIGIQSRTIQKWFCLKLLLFFIFIIYMQGGGRRRAEVANSHRQRI